MMLARRAHRWSRASALAAATLALGVSLLAPTARGEDREACVSAFDRGQELQRNDKLRASRASFVACASDKCPAPLRKDCAQALASVDADLPTVVLGARDTSGQDLVPAAVYIDDEPAAADGRALPCDPGQHVIRFEHPPDAPVIERIVLRVGERNREILATFPATSSPAPGLTTGAASNSIGSRMAAPPLRTDTGRGPRPTAWMAALTGVGAIGIGSFAYFGLTGLSTKQELLGSCAPACSDADVSRVRSRYIAADVSLGIGLVAIGIATFLFILSPSHGAPAAAASVQGGR